jgi:RNA polymerase sigma-70 factor (ECF subfamily)
MVRLGHVGHCDLLRAPPPWRIADGDLPAGGFILMPAAKNLANKIAGSSVGVTVAMVSGSFSFAEVALPHLDAAYNLARWLMGSAEEADDVVQDAMTRALTYFPTYRGANARAWILQIVRNTAYTALQARRQLRTEPLAAGDDKAPGGFEIADPADDPEAALLRARDRRELDRLLADLPVELRETVVLRELEELSYRDIAQVTGVPVGTVMSRMWRARRQLPRAARAAK